jgi:hypothetical protein
MILLSDLMIFGRMAPPNATPLINETIWLLYFSGELVKTIALVGKTHLRPCAFFP